MDIIKGTGVIEEITTKNGKKGEFYKIIIDGRTYNAFGDTEAFSQLEAKSVKSGTSVGFEYSEHVSGEYTYKNMLKFVELKESEAKEIKTSVSGNKTGESIARMNSLTNAIGFLNLNKEVIAQNLKELPKDKQIVSEETVLRLADQFYKYIVGEK